MILNQLFKQASKLFSTRRHAFFATIGVVLCVIFIFIMRVVGKEGFNANREHSTNEDNKKEANLLFFYADWCPHCKVAKPEWEKLKKENEGVHINGYDLVYTEYNCDNPTPDVDDLIRKYNIKGYPTVKLVKDGEVIDYDAKPTASTMKQFLDQVLI